MLFIRDGGDDQWDALVSEHNVAVSVERCLEGERAQSGGSRSRRGRRGRGLTPVGTAGGVAAVVGVTLQLHVGPFNCQRSS